MPKQQHYKLTNQLNYFGKKSNELKSPALFLFQSAMQLGLKMLQVIGDLKMSLY